MRGRQKGEELRDKEMSKMSCRYFTSLLDMLRELQRVEAHPKRGMR